jgi:hypothetical protein
VFCTPKPFSAQRRIQVKPPSSHWECRRQGGRWTPGSVTVTFSSAPTVLGSSRLLRSVRPKPLFSVSRGLRLTDRNLIGHAASEPCEGVWLGSTLGLDGSSRRDQLPGGRWMGRSCGCRLCACGGRTLKSPLYPSRRRTHLPNRPGGLRNSASLASASWLSVNQIALGMRACQIRAIRQRIQEIGRLARLKSGRPFAGTWPTSWSGKEQIVQIE